VPNVAIPAQVIALSLLLSLLRFLQGPEYGRP
jgi:hypothetical protein